VIPLHPEIQTGFSGKICCAQKRNTEYHAMLFQYAASSNLNTTTLKTTTFENNALLKNSLMAHAVFGFFITSTQCNRHVFSLFAKVLVSMLCKWTNKHNLCNSFLYAK